MGIGTIFFVTLITISNCYIMPLNDTHDCISVSCENNGTLQMDTCTCICQHGYSGILCEQVLVQSEWPEGSFSLPMSMFGCPEEYNRGWSWGYVNLTLPSSAPVQIWNDDNIETIEPNILGPYHLHSLQLNFCIKERILGGTNQEWGKGNYCLLKAGLQCPNGFADGQITINGYTFIDDDIGGILPEINISASSLTLNFCCREDRDGQKLQLPSKFPFNLFPGPTNDSCQQVEGMLVQKNLFYMVDVNSSWVFTGKYPNMDNATYSERIGIPFCYYIPYDRWECYYEDDDGVSYNGRVNVSESGKHCKNWANVSADFVNSKHWYGEFEENFCRNYGEYERTTAHPVCVIDDDLTMEKCTVSICDYNDPNISVLGAKKPFYNIPGKGPEYASDGLVVSGQAFRAHRPVVKPWYQIDLQEHIEVHAVKTYRYQRWFPVTLRYIGTYVSKHQWDFLTYGALRCDDLRFPRKASQFRFQCKRPIVGQYVTLRNFDTTDGSNGYRFYIMSLQEVQIYGKVTTCGRPLGMITGNIYSYQIEESSTLYVGDTYYMSYKGRVLNPGIGWCSSTDDKTPWLMVDLIVPTKVQGLLLQGWTEGQTRKLIRKFTISYGVKKGNLFPYEDPKGHMKIFYLDEAMAATSVQRFIFTNEIMARFVRIYPIRDENENACLKMEVIGCQKQAVRDLFCKPGSIDYGFEEVKGHVWWMEEPYKEPYFYKGVPAIETCRDLCLQNNCTSLSYHLSKHECTLHEGHRYNPQYYSWWVTNVPTVSIPSHRLCFKELKDVNHCGQKIQIKSNEIVTITSPGAPLMYEQGLNCSWEVRVDNDKYAKLEIIFVQLGKTATLAEIKELGVYDINPGFCKDTLTIQSSSNEKTVIDQSNENQYSDTVFVSSTSSISINLLTCFQTSPQGQNYFEIKSSSEEIPGCNIVAKGCQATCIIPTAYISSDRFPSEYQDGDNCIWTIEGTFGQFVDLEILNIDIPNDGSSCAKSFVAVYDTNLKGEERLIDRFCKENRPYEKIRSRWQRLRIEFRASSGSVGRGFLGKYEIKTFTQTNDNVSNSDCSQGWDFYDNSCYRLYNFNESAVSGGLTWIQAEEFCYNLNAHLVSINTKGEMDFIHYSLTTVWDREESTEFYIGLRKNMKGDIDSYQWTDRSPLTFTAWYKNPTTGIAQPDGLTNERCTSISLYSIHEMDDWNDIACAYDRIRSFICEKGSTSKTTDYPNNMIDQLNITSQKNSSRFNSSVYFECKNNQLITSTFVCDGENDCIDNSDEEQCGTECTSSQFECDNGQCISISLYCDFIPQCQDGSDETVCERTQCSDTEWQCNNGQCIPIKQRCDLQKNCFDNSDEENCGFCDSKSFECYDQKCIPQSLVCDGYVDCSGRFSEDENQGCQNFVHRSCAEWWSLGKRQNGEYMINMGLPDETPATVECRFLSSNGSIQVTTIVHHQQEEIMQSKLSKIDKQIDYMANDVLIEALKEDSSCRQSIALMCHSTHVSHDFEWYADDGTRLKLSDRTSNCSCPFANKCKIGKQTCNCNTTMSTWRLLGNNDELEDTGIITNESLLPIRRIFTPDPKSVGRWFEFKLGTLECTKELSLTSTGFLCRSGVTVPITMQCLLDYDKYGEVMGCRDLSHLEKCETFKCPMGFVKCRNSYCIGVELMCDGVKHCAGGEDEMNCENSTCPGLLRCKDSSVCLDVQNVCDGIKDCPNNEDEFFCTIKCPVNCTCDGLSLDCPAFVSQDINIVPKSARKLNLRYSDFSLNLPLLDDFRTLAELNMTYCGVSNLPPYFFSNLSNLYSLDMSHNNISTLVSYTFYGLRNLKSLILHGNSDLANIEPHAFIGMSKLSHLSIKNTRLSVLKRETFIGLDSLLTIDLSENMIKAIEDDTFFSLSTVKSLDVTNNRIEDFSNGIFNGLSTLETLHTDAFVFCCLKPKTVSSDMCFPKEDEFSSCDDLMRNDVLRWFLWIIGVSALLGNFGVIIYRLTFDRATLKKGHGILIANLGVSDFFMGVYLLIIASSDLYFRGRYIWNDLSWRRGGICKFAGVMSTIASECSVIFLCFITIDRIIAVRFPFGQYRITQKKALVACGIAWGVIFLLAVVPLIPSSYFMGQFYSRSAVCLALPLTRDKPAGWEYGTAIFIIFNFLVFIKIAFGQITIYREISAAMDAKIRSQRKNQDVAIARGLFMVVLTDFICWFPVGVMGIMALSGKAIPGEVYAWTAVFILPINSALNPFLYTFSTIIKQRKRGGSMRASVKSVKSVSSVNASAVDTAWTDVLGSDMFVFGNGRDGLYFLSDHLASNILSITEMTSVVKQLTTAILFLHNRGMIHGKLKEDNIVLTLKGEEISTVSVKVAPKLAEEDNDVKEDIFSLGQITKKMLRQHQQKLVTCNSVS